MGVAFAPAVAGGLDTHQPGVHRVLDVALQDAVLDQHVALRRAAFIVDIERATPVGQGAVVEHGHAFGRHALADTPGECRRTLAVEIALQAVANGLVQQHAGPARAQHDRHHAGRCRARVEVGQRRVDRLVDIERELLVLEVTQAETSTATARADFAAAVRFSDHRDRQPHQRPHIGRAGAVGAGDHHDVVLGGHTGHHLHDAGVAGAGHFFDLLKQRDLLGAVERAYRVGGQVERAAGRDPGLARDLDAPVLARCGDAANRARGVEQRGLGDVVGVGKSGLLACHRPHANALVDREAAALDDALFQAPALVAGDLEVQVGIVDAVFADHAERGSELGLVQTEGIDQQLLGDG